jgi:tetratricopeptide (TPR) repeat protein
VAESLNNLGQLYDSQGRHAEAEPLYERGLAILEKALGPEYPLVATSLNNLYRKSRVSVSPIARRALLRV